MSVNELYWALLCFAGFYWVSLGLNRFNWMLVGLTGPLDWKRGSVRCDYRLFRTGGPPPPGPGVLRFSPRRSLSLSGWVSFLSSCSFLSIYFRFFILPSAFACFLLLLVVVVVVVVVDVARPKLFGLRQGHAADRFCCVQSRCTGFFSPRILFCFPPQLSYRVFYASNIHATFMQWSH